MKINIDIKIIELAGFSSVMQALRLPFGKECRSASHAEYFFKEEYGLATSSVVTVDPKDKKLLSTLVKRGDEHAKAIRGLIVYAEINAPRYWWTEMDTYRIGAERLSSESTMHIQGKGLSTEELVRMKEELNEGTMQKRVEFFSYQALRRIYFQRRNHRLPHWHVFCDWIETLPFADEWIIIQEGDKNE